MMEYWLEKGYHIQGYEHGRTLALNMNKQEKNQEISKTFGLRNGGGFLQFSWREWLDGKLEGLAA